MTDRELMQQALEALEDERYVTKYTHIVAAITALRKALEQPEQEPVAEVKVKMTGGNVGIATIIHEIYDPFRERLQAGDKLYTTPPQRPWVGLEAEDLAQIDTDEFWQVGNHMAIAMAVEAQLKERNT